MPDRPLARTDDGDETSYSREAPDADRPRDDDDHNGSRLSRKASPAGLKSRPSSARSRRQNSADWMHPNGHNGAAPGRKMTSAALSQAALAMGKLAPPSSAGASRLKPRRSPWSMSLLVLVTATLGIAMLSAILKSLVSYYVEPKGCRMSYMRPSYIHYSDFDTEHTRFATKYSLYLYREQGIDDEIKLRGIPVLFIPGNAGSYKQVRPIAAEAANYFHDILQQDGVSVGSGVRKLDFFTVDFNEDITAFHGQTLLDQAEYLNEAIRYILALYSDPQRSDRDSNLPDPTSVIVLGHSMGGVVARAMLVQPNYQANSINTIITMSAPHARPPVTFDGQIVQIYDEINDYWRHAYAQKWANDNPLWHVTLVSIAGGSLDTVVPSDYASLESLVPDTHGFTVFTTGIPTVWTSMDHQAILWCDQFRRVAARALYDIVDVERASQTKPRADRMRLLKKRLLPGIEAATERTLPARAATTLLTLGDEASRIVPAGSRLVVRNLGSQSRRMAHLIPIPPQGSPGLKRFTLLTDAALHDAGNDAPLEVLLCSVFAFQPSLASPQFSRHVDLSGGSGAPTKLACKNAASDSTLVPASTTSTEHPFFLEREKPVQPFSYLQYGLEHLLDHQFIAVLDQSLTPRQEFVVAEFSDQDDFGRKQGLSLSQLLTIGMSLTLPANRPVVVDVNVPAAVSALLAFQLRIDQPSCSASSSLFAPMVRQFLEKPYESKYFVNVRQAPISFHGIAPYMLPPMQPNDVVGLGFQFWSDPLCDSPLHIRLTLDLWGSLGKLYMRYRTVFAAFPLLVATMVLRKQFRVYDETGIFISFAESLDLSLRRSIPLLLLSLTLLSVSLGRSNLTLGIGSAFGRAGPDRPAGFGRNELLIGTEDPLFCPLISIIGIVCVGVCAVLHYVVLGLTRMLGLVYGLLTGAGAGGANGPDHARRTHSPAAISSTATPRRRMISTAILLFLVSTFIPYQFAYLVACLVQLFTTARAFRLATTASSAADANFHHYAHSILLLMMWVLPINLPILAVWVRNLAVHWLTPFSSHHNVLSIMPFILLVENLTTGRMVPQIPSGLRHVTSILLFGTALCAAVYGVSHAYVLHYLVNVVAAWLVVLHSTSDSWSLTTLGAMFEEDAGDDRKGPKAP
ncbi:GPI inositol deacylase [Purpureocillium takamizusanense]|uniref:GPI inositol-deacylase n=1 Tax=Purpureocillium takamizusanense TaxID=2060973 RepID=A0A9Q8QMW5_9HYPO|nr:GPI inositol deacylase [Purpureocillium takamizusanense]UNI22091.1 GPI inositol deacylase [Purpureocillium takamizusanense]